MNREELLAHKGHFAGPDEKVRYVYYKLKKINHANVNRKIKLKYPKIETSLIREEFNRFFSLAATNEDVAPTAVVDEYWHEYILHTKDYFHLCQALFGKYIHHQPHNGSKKDATKYYKLLSHTLQEYEKYYGEPNLKIWGLKRRKKI